MKRSYISITKSLNQGQIHLTGTVCSDGGSWSRFCTSDLKVESSNPGTDQSLQKSHKAYIKVVLQSYVLPLISKMVFQRIRMQALHTHTFKFSHFKVLMYFISVDFHDP